MGVVRHGGRVRDKVPALVRAGASHPWRRWNSGRPKRRGDHSLDNVVDTVGGWSPSGRVDSDYNPRLRDGFRMLSDE